MKPDKPVARRSDYTFEVLTTTEARRAAQDIIAAHHYTRSRPKLPMAMVLRREGQIVAVASLLPPLPPAARNLAPNLAISLALNS